ncbi:N-acetyltransferase [Agarivorans sp. Toyoura001]|uniref:GNAT family N-acetyltransferase n=1 Tax=Agarivorans sp. Toyoura001 TaxID=2283141 RepID=UPI0010D196A3|nr:GNAT family N-acetyltransferase [Agarivorans sp. Toyoura001]GDY25811.1 N-acetyltransferase [Agarivorans sp. Toyoura001]
MVTLRAITAKEFADYCEYFVDDYSRDIAANQGHSKERALELAQQTLEQSFPQGAESQGHQLLCIEQQSELIGYLWHSIQASDQSTYIYDFYVFPKQRNKGFGKLAMKALEQQLTGFGINQIKLRVAFSNQRALALYQEIGFVVTGYNMSKTITQ